IMISQMLGLEQNGIYAIGSKASQISQLIYTAFAGGWQFFAFSTMKDNDHPHLIGKVWKRLFLVTTMSFIFVYSFRDSIFSLLFEGVYQKGSQVMPYLFICPLLLMLYQINGTQFQIVKKTYFSPIILTVGALLNIILNFVLIPVIGIKGAAFATLIGYICTLSLSIFITSKFHLIDIDRKTIFLYILFCIIILITIFDLTVLNISLFAIYTLICLIGVKEKVRSVPNVIKYFFGGEK
ncbi:MAG TPA: polysaccharide biosynthesis C-terminal domain-containing protein, partial [Thermotogota bacterium]|nr:polysaccharide biosynthesis C-terminal domain-containing protein [Thermotogota bacterium]